MRRHVRARPSELARLRYGPQVRAGITPQVQQVRRAQDHPHVVMLARGTRCQLQTILPSVRGRRRQSACMGWGRPGVEGLLGRRRLKPVHVLARTGWTARVVTIRHAILRAGVRYRTLQPLDHQPFGRQRCAELPALLRQGSRRERATRGCAAGRLPLDAYTACRTLYANRRYPQGGCTSRQPAAGRLRRFDVRPDNHPDAPVFPPPSWPGSTACRPRWYVTVADRALDMLAVARLARRLSSGHEPG